MSIRIRNPTLKFKKGDPFCPIQDTNFESI